jgi:hypothetical protein
VGSTNKQTKKISFFFAQLWLSLLFHENLGFFALSDDYFCFLVWCVDEKKKVIKQDKKNKTREVQSSGTISRHPQTNQIKSKPSQAKPIVSTKKRKGTRSGRRRRRRKSFRVNTWDDLGTQMEMGCIYT